MSNKLNNQQPNRILGWNELLQLLPYSRTQLWRLIRAGQFPAPMQLGGRKVGWRESTIEAWIESREAVSWAPLEDLEETPEIAGAGS